MLTLLISRDPQRLTTALISVKSAGAIRATRRSEDVPRRTVTAGYCSPDESFTMSIYAINKSAVACLRRTLHAHLGAHVVSIWHLRTVHASLWY